MLKQPTRRSLFIKFPSEVFVSLQYSCKLSLRRAKCGASSFWLLLRITNAAIQTSLQMTPYQLTVVRALASTKSWQAEQNFFSAPLSEFGPFSLQILLIPARNLPIGGISVQGACHRCPLSVCFFQSSDTF